MRCSLRDEYRDDEVHAFDRVGKWRIDRPVVDFDELDRDIRAQLECGLPLVCFPSPENRGTDVGFRKMMHNLTIVVHKRDRVIW